MYQNYIYSVKELCDIFNINQNTFPSIARRLHINTDEFCQMKSNYYKANKRYYNELAYKKLEEYVKKRDSRKYSNKIQNNLILQYIQELKNKDEEIKYIQNENCLLDKSNDNLTKELEISNEKLTYYEKQIVQKDEKIKDLENSNKKLNEMIVKIENEYERKVEENINQANQIKELQNKGFRGLFNRNKKEEYNV